LLLANHELFTSTNFLQYNNNTSESLVKFADEFPVKPIFNEISSGTYCIILVTEEDKSYQKIETTWELIDLWTTTGTKKMETSVGTGAAAYYLTGKYS
jgi:DNA gyrase inhibitor GyrI